MKKIKPKADTRDRQILRRIVRAADALRDAPWEDNEGEWARLDEELSRAREWICAHPKTTRKKP